MSFRRDLEEWVARQFVRRSGPKTAEHIRRLLRGDDSGRLSPLLLSGLPVVKSILSTEFKILSYFKFCHDIYMFH